MFRASRNADGRIYPKSPALTTKAPILNIDIHGIVLVSVTGMASESALALCDEVLSS